MNRLYFFVFILFLLSYTKQAKAQNSSNKGKDFWVAYTGHIDNLNSRLTLFLSADQITDYEVFVGSTLVASSATSGVIPANTCLPIVIDPNAIPVYISSSNQKEINKAIHVIATRPISLYSVISYSARTGGTMVLPTNTLGKEYYTYSFKNGGTSPGFAEFTIIATEDNTNIEITPTSAERNNAHQSGVTFTITLNKGQIYQYQSANSQDLTGSYVKSIDGCRPIAIFSGNTWAAFCEVGNNVNPSGGDNLYQQLFPVSSWGRKFVTAPFFNTLHGSTEVLKVIVAENNTTITINGSSTNANGTLLTNPYSKGDVITFSSTTANVISSTNPISVAQYQTSQTCNPNNSNNNNPVYPGDPEITVLNPVEQTLSNITVYSKLENVPTRIANYYLNVIIKTVDISSFRLDGNPVTGFIAIDAEYSYVTIDVTALQPQHRLTAIGGFSAIAYGYGTFESYAYLAGANIQDFTFQPTSVVTGQPITSGCLGEEIKISINLPYRATKLVWEIAGDALYTESSPVEMGSFIRNNIKYFTFEYYKNIAYNIAGDYTFKITATKPTADNCGNTEELIVDFTVDNEPKAAFEPLTENCQGNEVQFKDKSESNSSVRTISSWLWDFGDGSPMSTEQNPIHKYANPGVYPVILTVNTNTKCGKTSDAVWITINPKPEAKFTAPTDFCVNRDLVITNLSSIISRGSITNYLWDFGDGIIPIPINSSSPPIFKYTTPGLKTIKLTVTSDKNCVSKVFSQNINVVALPEVNFETPGYCVNDGLAKFKNLTKDYDGTTANLNFEWNFGDGTPSVGPSAAYDGEHIYTAPGSYDVTLKVFNQYGCEADIKLIPFIVNPFVTSADFTIQNELNLCSGNDVVINNTSTISAPGKILKIEVYKDFDNEPTSFVTMPNPLSDDILLSYPKFGGNIDKTYNIKLIAYSGETCFKEITKTITIKPSPILTFNAISAVCENTGIVSVNLATEVSGITGSGTYSGIGIVDATNGWFDPKVAGVGSSHTITYTFNPLNGCSNFITQTIEVKPVPTADAGSDFYILAGGEKQISATAKGNGLTYEWAPSIGLSNPSILNPIANPEKDTKYTLTVKSSQGCVMNDDVYVYVLQNVNAPNSFTPNGDGVNDFWNIKYLDTYPNANVEIYNRNGERIYFSKGYAVPFDGNYKNQPLPVGTYYYIINPNSGRKSITGSLTIIR